MGRLYDAVVAIDRVIESRGLDAFKVKGQISMKAGIFLAIIFPDTPDDEQKLQAVKQAAEEVLGQGINV